jgi:hypothetical protein
MDLFGFVIEIVVGTQLWLGALGGLVAKPTVGRYIAVQMGLPELPV